MPAPGSIPAHTPKGTGCFLDPVGNPCTDSSSGLACFTSTARCHRETAFLIVNVDNDMALTRFYLGHTVLVFDHRQITVSVPHNTLPANACLCMTGGRSGYRLWCLVVHVFIISYWGLRVKGEADRTAVRRTPVRQTDVRSSGRGGGGNGAAEALNFDGGGRGLDIELRICLARRAGGALYGPRQKGRT